MDQEKQLLHTKLYARKLISHPDTKKCETISMIKGNVQLTIIDTPGLLRGKEKKQIQVLYDYVQKEKNFSTSYCTVCQLPQ